MQMKIKAYFNSIIKFANKIHACFFIELDISTLLRHNSTQLKDISIPWGDVSFPFKHFSNQFNNISNSLRDI